MRANRLAVVFLIGLWLSAAMALPCAADDSLQAALLKPHENAAFMPVDGDIFDAVDAALRGFVPGIKRAEVIGQGNELADKLSAEGVDIGTSQWQSLDLSEATGYKSSKLYGPIVTDSIGGTMRCHFLDAYVFDGQAYRVSKSGFGHHENCEIGGHFYSYFDYDGGIAAVIGDINSLKRLSVSGTKTIYSVNVDVQRELAQAPDQADENELFHGKMKLEFDVRFQETVKQYPTIRLPDLERALSQNIGTLFSLDYLLLIDGMNAHASGESLCDDPDDCSDIYAGIDSNGNYSVYRRRGVSEEMAKLNQALIDRGPVLGLFIIEPSAHEKTLVCDASKVSPPATGEMLLSCADANRPMKTLLIQKMKVSARFAGFDLQQD